MMAVRRATKYAKSDLLTLLRKRQEEVQSKREREDEKLLVDAKKQAEQALPLLSNFIANPTSENHDLLHEGRFMLQFHTSLWGARATESHANCIRFLEEYPLDEIELTLSEYQFLMDGDLPR